MALAKFIYSDPLSSIENNGYFPFIDYQESERLK